MIFHNPIVRLVMLLLLLVANGCSGLKDVRMIVPAAVERGKRVDLVCLYDLEGDPLYAIKWYRNGFEFFRYAPRETPPMKQFAIGDVHVDGAHSNATHVVLEHVGVKTSGVFDCEISADAPSFFTGSASGTLQVIDVPKTGPTIEGLKRAYRINDTLKAECLSPRSRSIVDLQWTIDDAPADAALVKRHKPHRSPAGFYSSRLSLRFLVTKHMFVNDEITIACTATLHDIYTRTTEKTIHSDRRQHPPETTTFISWDDALPAERYPDTTLVFTTVNGNAPPKQTRNACERTFAPPSFALLGFCLLKLIVVVR